MGRFLTYVLAAFAASAAFSAVEAVQEAVVLGVPTLENDPKLLAAAVAGWLVALVGMALAFLAIIGLLWLLIQLALGASVGAASGLGAVALGVLLVVAVSVGASFATWTFMDLGVDPSAFGGLDSILLWEAVKGIAPGFAWGLAFWRRPGGRAAAAAPVGAR